MITPDFLAPFFHNALPYDAYVRTGTTDQQASWNAFHARIRLTPAQSDLVRAFSRRVNLLVISGTWCGDCVQQCPILDHLARLNPADRSSPHAPGVDLRFVDRDQAINLSNAVKICGGNRVPTALFLNEDLEFLALAGDKSLSRLRALALRQLGASCALPGASLPDDELTLTIQDWANDLERAHLIARLSAKLRQRHQD